MNTNPIIYETTIIRTMTLEYKLINGDGTPEVQITFRKINSQWWDIANVKHTQETWDAIKKMGNK